MCGHKCLDRLRTCALALIHISAGRRNSFFSWLLQYNLCDALSLSEVKTRVDHAVMLHAQAANLRAVTIAVGAGIITRVQCSFQQSQSNKIVHSYAMAGCAF